MHRGVEVVQAQEVVRTKAPQTTRTNGRADSRGCHWEASELTLGLGYNVSFGHCNATQDAIRERVKKRDDEIKDQDEM